MEGFAVTAITTIPTSTASPGSTASSFLSPRIFFTQRRRVTARNLARHRKLRKFLVFASKEDPRLDQWDQMELKFGKMLGEDPKLTMAKIMGKKVNPEASYLEIEESFYRNNGKAVDVKEVPLEGLEGGQSPGSLDGLNLVRPVPKKGVTFQEGSSQPVAPVLKKPSESSGSLDGLNLVRPVPKRGVTFQAGSSQPVAPVLKKPTQPTTTPPAGSSVRSSVPNVILRKPTVVNEDDVEDKPSRLRMKRNLSLSMRNEPTKEKYSDMTLLRRPEPNIVDDSQKPEIASDIKSVTSEDDGEKEDGQEAFSDFTLIKKPEAISFASKSADKEEVIDNLELLEDLDDPNLISQQKNEYQLHNSRDVDVDSNNNLSSVASLQTKPKRLAEPAKGISDIGIVGTAEVTSESPLHGVGEESLTAASKFEEYEEYDWMKAEDLLRSGGRGVVVLLSSSTRGFAVSFGSLIGFLPYRNLAARWKFLAFESWLREKGLDPTKYKQNLGVIGRYDAPEKIDSETGGQGSQLLDGSISGEISPDMKLEDLLRIYDQEKLRFLSSFVGQKTKANVLVADRKLRKLIFSVKPKEKEEMIEKKRSLMAKLRVGDVVKCYIKKITYFGIFVEVEGVPALIHQTEVSWDATLDPMSFFKVGQIIEAKVHQLDFSLERIFLSLKEITPDPLVEALESVVGDHSLLEGSLEAAQAESEWPEVESLIKELEQIEGVQNVTKGRFFLSPGLAPTFQVYMASMFENQYKLLARAGNKVQEVIVEASLDKEEMKSVIMTCTNRVE